MKATAKLKESRDPPLILQNELIQSYASRDEAQSRGNSHEYVLAGKGGRADEAKSLEVPEVSSRQAHDRQLPRKQRQK